MSNQPTEPLFSLCQLTLRNSSFLDDLQVCADLGIRGCGLEEAKIIGSDEASLRAKMDELGVAATLCCPRTTSILPSVHVKGASDPDSRVEELCEGIRRLAKFDPVSIFMITGAQGDYDDATAWRIVVDGMREAMRVAREENVNLSVEAMRAEYRPEWCFINSMADCLRLIEAVGDGLKITYDTYHLWDSKDVLPLTREYASLIAGVQVADFRQPMRGFQDRKLPGDGVANLGQIWLALDQGGFDGWYDLEVFSSLEFPDSIWKRPTKEWVADGEAKFLRTWNERVTA
jgi:sugar phosphate isomerase/epimerase